MLVRVSKSWQQSTNAEAPLPAHLLASSSIMRTPDAQQLEQPLAGCAANAEQPTGLMVMQTCEVPRASGAERLGRLLGCR